MTKVDIIFSKNAPPPNDATIWIENIWNKHTGSYNWKQWTSRGWKDLFVGPGEGGSGTGDVTMSQVNAAINTHNASLTAHADIRTALGLRVLNTDPRLSDARTPLAHNHPISGVTGLQSALDSFALKTELPNMTNYVLSNDSRLTDARTPLSHSHSMTEVEGLEDKISDIESRIDSPGVWIDY